MIKKMWKWLTLADLPEQESARAAFTHTVRFYMTEHPTHMEYSACCTPHLFEVLEQRGFEGLGQGGSRRV